MKFWRKISALAICLLLVGYGLLPPIAPVAADPDPRGRIQHETQDVDPKMDSRLEAEISARPHDNIPVIIVLQAQQVYFEVDAAESLTAETQLQLLTSLAAIWAENITQHWIINAVSATVYAPKIAGIAARADVEKVWLDEVILLPEPCPESPVVENAIKDTLIGADKPPNDKIALYAGGVIAGMVTDVAGYPVPGAQVLGRKQLMGVGWALLAVTAADGGFVTDNLASGMYEIRVSPARYVRLTPTWVPDIAVIAGETTTKNIILYWDYGDPIIHAPPMWAAGYDGRGIKIAILDTGIDYTHPDLAGRVIAARDFTGEGTVMDWHGHGTHVAGIAAGAYNPEWQISGVAPGAYVLNARIFFGVIAPMTRTSWILRAIEWSMDQGAHILNMSFGAHQGDGTGRKPIDMASANAVAAGHIVVPAAGNEAPGDSTILSPAIAHDVIAAAGSGARDGIIWFSSRGPAGDGRVAVDVAAPGLWVIAPRPSHIRDRRGRPPEFGYYDDLSGTSMSAPHVAGAAALLLHAFPGLTPAEVETALMSSADDLGVCILAQGAGRLNVKEAYLALKEGILVNPPQWSVGRTLPDAFTQTFTVTNNAAAPATLDITKSVMTDTQGSMAGDWITMPANIMVPAGATATFDAIMTVPAGAAAGTYFGYIRIGDATIPVSVNVLQAVNHTTVLDITGTVNEDTRLGGWGDHVYYTLHVQPGVANLSLTLDWTDTRNSLELVLHNPAGEITGETLQSISVDHPHPGKWTVLVKALRVEPRTVETYTLTIDATGLPAGEIIGLSVSPSEVVRYSEATFTAIFRNNEAAAVTVSGTIDIYYVGEHGRVWQSSIWLEGRTVEPDKSTSWIIPAVLQFMPGNYKATARLHYSGIIAEKTRVFILTPRGTGVFTGIVTSAVTGSAMEGAIVEAIDPVTDAVVACTTTDADGIYHLSVDEGTWEFRVYAAGYVEIYREEDVLVDYGMTVTVDFMLLYVAPPTLITVAVTKPEIVVGATTAIMATVTGAGNRPFADLEVTFTVAPEGAGIIYPTVVSTDAQGVAEAAITAMGIAQITVTASINYPPLQGTAAIRFVPQAYTIDLAVGWNLISLPLIPLDPAIGTILYGIEGAEVVWSYDAYTDRWLAYKPDVLEELTEMVDGKGYWIRMSAPATLTVSGFQMPIGPVLPPIYEVLEGWNLIGFRSLAPMRAADYLAGVEWAKLWTFHQGIWTNLGPEDDMEPGRGYWLFATAPGKIAIAAE